MRATQQTAEPREQQQHWDLTLSSTRMTEPPGSPVLFFCLSRASCKRSWALLG